MLDKLKNNWKGIGKHRRAGVVVPLFSIYSKDSIGIGDFGDLRLVIDWCKKTGNSILQLLPLNYLGGLNCPYDCLSSFALEPVYLDLKGFYQIESFKEEICKLKERFPFPRTYVDYAIRKEKIRLLKEMFLSDYQNNSSEIEFRDFIKNNQYWIEDFALYKVIKDYHQGKPWYEWEIFLQKRDKRNLERFKREYLKEVLFEMWLQWQAFKQLRKIKSYAQQNNILLKGDLPLLVSRDSADVWAHPEYFKLDLAAGAPPDMYCAKGQRWGMAPYNWEIIAKDRYRYLKEKLRYLGNFYDILRIDHVVGLFRIWSIPYNEPLENQGLNGFFDPEDETKWEERGRGILIKMLENTELFLCAEDLGVIPEVCTRTLQDLEIPGNDVQRWKKDYKISHDFLKPEQYRLLSVSMLSTHDTTNWPAWWQYEAGTVDEELFKRRCSDHRNIGFEAVKDRLFDLGCSRHGRLRWRQEINSVEKLVEILGKKKEELADFIDFYQNTYKEKEKLWNHLGLKGEMREEVDPEILRYALRITLKANSVFCINTIIDYLGLLDLLKPDPYPYRINTPGTISEKNWSLVIPLSLEDLLASQINKEIYEMIVSSGRI
ncbi:MAG: 4-alpha-glucanotransferase [Candidatus Omnitrophica bacterium]|nr:4-alpha-glucanotransferase [Candidatus Omnitrophota bacterium]